MKVAIQCSSYGERCGINSYTNRLANALSKKGVEVDVFINRPLIEPDIISIQYEPGIMPPPRLKALLDRFVEPVVLTAHHTNGLDDFYPMLDGVVLHDETQILNRKKPWDYVIIPHPGIMYPKKDKDKLRIRLKLPRDKTIIGTAGFITGTGKRLPSLLEELLIRLEDDQFLYFITSMWKAGDMGREREMRRIIKKYDKEDQVRIDTEFVTEKMLNNKMQACDLLFAWNAMPPNMCGGQSGIASDMYCSYTKLIARQACHFNFILSCDKVIAGRPNPNEFAEDVISLAKDKKELNNIQDPSFLSWDKQVEKYIEYFEQFL